MDRWRELLWDDLKNVETGYREAGKGILKIGEVLANLDLPKDHLIQLLVQNELKYFAAKVNGGDYEKVAQLEADVTKKEVTNGPATA